ncbi:conjugal transfer protein TraP [Pseudomonas mosselii]|uniref:Conjugal transfer protein TraP n=1 Tax=Pseudomonas mosselii TaxID=78327 RepID=A0A7W2Q101_9PSED|nr:conjugal transfer protein TraP [Pseudomonas mosselii]MBA6068060.1 conjugal transfer protein TraP [Pseudomonas mosselii]
MSEFSLKDDDKLVAPQATASASSEKMSWLSKPIILGMSAPWIVVTALVICAAAWYLFAPDGQPSTNELAFGAGGMELVREEPVQPARMAFPSPPVAAAPADVGAGDEALRQMKEFGEANRQAIKLLSETVRTQGGQLSSLQQQVSDLQAQVALASVRSAPVEKAATVRKHASPPSAPKQQSAVAGMRVNAVQADMAWIYWRDRTWAVQVGDRVGESASSVIVTSIDARARLVHTSAGTIK